jgi:Tfp pilus assembly PilM family ATPase
MLDIVKKRKIYPIGLDWSKNSLRAVQCKQLNRKISLYRAMGLCKDSLLWGEPLERSFDGFDDESQIEDLESSVDPNWEHELKRLMRLGHFVGDQVILHCPLHRLDMRPIALPSGSNGLSSDAIRGALRLQIADQISFPVDQAVVDYYILKHDLEAGRLNVMAIAADGEWIKKRIEILSKASLNCVGVDALPCVLGRLLSHTLSDSAARGHQESHFDAGDLFGVLDIGGQGSDLIVMNQQLPVFCRRFTFGGSVMTNTLSQQLMIPYSQAERLKQSYGMDQQDSRPGAAESPAENDGKAPASGKSQRHDIAKAIFGAWQSTLEDFTEGVIRSLNYVITEQRGARLKAIYVTGAAGHTKALCSYLSGVFGIPVENLNASILDEIVSPLPQSRVNPGAWTTALGLALPASQVILPKPQVMQEVT